MQYCPISLLFSLPAVASDSTLTKAASWATIVGLPLTILAIVIARSAFNAQKKALEHQQVLGAWSLLAQKGTGDLGRKDALEFLHKQGKSLAGLDLSNAHLVGLKLNGADLTGCNFTGANLEDAEFVECGFQYAIFDKCDMTNVTFVKCGLRDRTFKECNLQFAKFVQSNCNWAIFRCCDLMQADFSGCLFDEPTFEQCFVYRYPILPVAPEGYEFVFDQNEDGTKKIYTLPGQMHHYNMDGTKEKIVEGVNIGYIVLTKKP
jgi:hypothetical protein